MPTTSTDRRILAACVAAVVVGAGLVVVGVLLEPPLRLARWLNA